MESPGTHDFCLEHIYILGRENKKKKQNKNTTQGLITVLKKNWKNYGMG